MKKTTLTDEVADDYLQLCNEGRFTNKCVPRGYIPDLNWTTIHDNPDQPIKPVKQEEDPNETTVTPAAPTEVEGPPSSHLRSKTKQQSTTIKQEQLECNPVSLDPPECNQAKLEVNQVEVAKYFCCFFWLCIICCTVLGNVVRWCMSSLLGSYIHQELFSCSIGTVFNNVNNTNVFSCFGI